MARICLLLAVLGIVLMPALSQAVGLEFAVGAWNQSPSGELAYEPLTDQDILDVEDDLGSQEEDRITGRLKLDLPAPLPNLALMATPMRFEGTGSTEFDFNFGGQEFRQDVEFNSKVRLDHYDAGLFYAIPLIGTASLDMLNLELGLNARVFDLEAEIKQPGTGLKEFESATVSVPMLYAALQFQPLDILALEAEARGVSYDDDSVVSLIGRLKLELFDPFFAAGGYRYESVDIEHDDIKADAEIQGPFFEVGCGF